MNSPQLNGLGLTWIKELTQVGGLKMAEDRQHSVKRSAKYVPTPGITSNLIEGDRLTGLDDTIPCDLTFVAVKQDYDDAKLTLMTAKIMLAYLQHHRVAKKDLPSLMRDIYTKLWLLKHSIVKLPQAVDPAVPVLQSVTPEYIVCLEDGRKVRRLKSHLQSAHGLTPAQYRKRWNLLELYPMNVSGYSQWARSTGRRRKSKPKVSAPTSSPFSPGEQLAFELGQEIENGLPGADQTEDGAREDLNKVSTLHRQATCKIRDSVMIIAREEG